MDPLEEVVNTSSKRAVCASLIPVFLCCKHERLVSDLSFSERQDSECVAIDKPFHYISLFSLPSRWILCVFLIVLTFSRSGLDIVQRELISRKYKNMGLGG